MRDIRKDLRERLDAVFEERKKLEARLSDIDAREAGIKAMLRAEEESFAGQAPPLFPDSSNGSGLAQLITAALESAKRPLALGDIKEELLRTPYAFGERNAGRAIHFALVGMSQSGLVERLEDKRWALKGRQ